MLGAPGRDPRKHCVGLFYLIDTDSSAKPIGGDDAVSAAWVPIEQLNAENVAADHVKIVNMFKE